MALNSMSAEHPVIIEQRAISGVAMRGSHRRSATRASSKTKEQPARGYADRFSRSAAGHRKRDRK
jgi:hypothetical protein